MSVERRRNLMGADRAPVSNGIYILYTDKTISPYDELTPGKTPVGVVLKDDYVSLVLHPSEARDDMNWSSNTRTTISGVTTTDDLDTALADYAGKSNTDAVYVSGLQGTAFTFARNAVYADGRTGYLPACGEMEQIRLNVDNINTALGLIRGTRLDFSSKYYWSSTQCSKSDAWYWIGYPGYMYWYSHSKSNNHRCRSVAAY